jgi:hypothetical protein
MDTIKVLTSLPSTDGNYISALNRASNAEITQAVDIMLASDGKHKSRIVACKREMRKRRMNLTWRTPNPKYKEILKLMQMLDEANIPYQRDMDMHGYIVHYPEWDDCVCSIIEHDGSYGHDEDLLEICGLLTDEERAFDCVCGHLTADDVFCRIEKHFKESEVARSE